MINFNFSEKGSRTPFSITFCVWFFKSLMLHSINWPNFIVSLPLLLEILGIMCITIVCQSGCDVINFEISLIFLIKPFCYTTKKSRQKLKYLENEKSFWGEIKSIFHHFKGLSAAKNCLRPENATLRFWLSKLYERYRHLAFFFWPIISKKITVAEGLATNFASDIN